MEEILSESEKNTFSIVAQQLGVQGVTIVAASGDDGVHYWGAR